MTDQSGAGSIHAGDIHKTDVLTRSEDVVARAIEDEFILVPITAGIGDLDGALYTMNETGREIWERLAPGKTVAELVAELAEIFDAPEEMIAADVTGILAELMQLRMVAVG